MKKIMIVATIFAAALNLVSCNPKELLKPGLEPAFVVIDSDTIKTRADYKNSPKKFINAEAAPLSMIVGDTIIVYKKNNAKVKPSKVAKLDKIKDNTDPLLKGKAFRMVAVGQGFLTGYRDGGLFNEAMETSLPSLLANQMGIEFNQATFDNADYNGFNRRVKSNFNPTGGPVPKYKVANNNTGVEMLDNRNKAFLKKSKSVRLDNYAVAGDYGDNNEFANRIGKDLYKYGTVIKEQKADFYIIQDHFEGAMAGKFTIHNQAFGESGYGFYGRSISNGLEGFVPLSTPFSSPIGPWNQRVNIYYNLKKEKVGTQKGVFLNTPDVFDFPYLTWVNKELVQKEFDKYQSNITNTSSYAFILPSSEIDTLLGVNVNVNQKRGVGNRQFKKPIGINNWEAEGIKADLIEKNMETQALSKQLGYAYVDVYAMYKKIHSGAYIGQDGVKVSVKDFYSSDGIYPSAFGQAVITNETIRTINAFYAIDIPYINTSLFLNK